MESAVSASVNWHTKDRSLVLRKQVGRPKATWRGSVELSARPFLELGEVFSSLARRTSLTERRLSLVRRPFLERSDKNFLVNR